ncbi:MAG: hypothetical protein JAZ12_12780 [Candidatus Thiodiazotropha taylori]|nr:hypothetical protein [Candidatus Thiodiazotropha taylori]
MIHDIKECVPEEVQSQITYLAQTPVRSIASLLRSGQYRLNKGVIRSLNFLGDLKTEFGQIGPLVPSTEEGEKKFRVLEIVPILKANPQVEDNGLLVAIEEFMAKDKRREVYYNITIFDTGSEYIIKDGNKRSISFYENNKTFNSDIINYPVFVVSSCA